MKKAQVCGRCGYEWVPRTSKPKACPYCKSYKYVKKNATKENK